MPIEGEYEPSTWDWVANQVAAYEASGGTEGNTLMDTGMPVVIVTMRGKASGKVRKTALMRVEHEGEYALVASKGGAASNPHWYANMTADPHIMIQDGPAPADFVVREIAGDERDVWWARAVAAFPQYAKYQEQTDRVIPVLVASPMQ